MTQELSPTLASLTGHQTDSAWLTVVIPTYNERENVPYIISRLETSALSLAIDQVIFVDDDSPDGTWQITRQLSSSLRISCIHRIGRSGLSSAVIEGMMLARTPYIAVMDADGQHDPKDLELMASSAKAKELDLMIGSRFLTQSSQESHTGLRHQASKWGNCFARLMLGRPISDPLTGLFVVRHAALMTVVRALKPIGFKILFDLLFLMRDGQYRIDEHQIHFGHRHAGQSKLDASVVIEFVDQITHRLSRGAVPERFLSFAAVGGVGVLVHFATLYSFVEAGFIFWLAQSLATLAAMVSNYILNNEITFRRMRRKGGDWFAGLLLFVAFCSVGAFANVGIASALFESDYGWWLSGLAGVIVGTVFNFSLARSYVWRYKR